MNEEKPSTGILSNVAKFAALVVGSPSATTHYPSIDLKASEETMYDPKPDEEAPSIGNGLAKIGMTGVLGGTIATGGVLAMSAMPLSAPCGLLVAAWTAKNLIVPGIREGISEILQAVALRRSAAHKAPNTSL